MLHLGWKYSLLFGVCALELQFGTCMMHFWLLLITDVFRSNIIILLKQIVVVIFKLFLSSFDVVFMNLWLRNSICLTTCNLIISCSVKMASPLSTCVNSYFFSFTVKLYLYSWNLFLRKSIWFSLNYFDSASVNLVWWRSLTVKSSLFDWNQKRNLHNEFFFLPDYQW